MSHQLKLLLLLWKNSKMYISLIFHKIQNGLKGAEKWDFNGDFYVLMQC